MDSNKPLLIAEKFLLLSLHDEKGVSLVDSLTEWLAGSILIELTLLERFEKQKKKIRLINSDPTGDEILDEAIAFLAGETKWRSINWILEHLVGKLKPLKDRLQYRLVERGILRVEEKKVLWVFNVERFPMTDATEEYEVRKRIRSIVLAGNTPDPEYSALISLAYKADLTNELFDKPERKEARKRMKEIAKGDALAKQVSDIVDETQAVLVAILGASIAASVAATS